MNRNTIIKSLLVSVLLFANILLYSQERILQFEKLTIEDGLSHNSVNCFLHDSRGYIWIGTFEGLNLYNGYDLKMKLNIYHIAPGGAKAREEALRNYFAQKNV